MLAEASATQPAPSRPVILGRRRISALSESQFAAPVVLGGSLEVTISLKA